MDKDLPLVSVGIITYNQKKYLQKCIESVLEQYYPNIEIVIGDDGSTDGTQNMLKEYEKKFAGKFKLILHKKNRGITYNANSVLENCNGKYVVILGGDDLIGDKNRLYEQVLCFEKDNKIALCGTYTKIIDSNGNFVKIKKYKKNKPFYTVCDLIRSKNSLTPVVSYMFKKKDCPKFDYRLPIASDSLFFYQIAKKGYIKIIPKPLSTYRIHHSHANKIGYLDDSIVSLALSEYYFPECLSAIRKARGNLYANIGKEYMKQNDFRAKYYFWHSFILRPKLKTLILFFSSLRLKNDKV